MPQSPEELREHYEIERELADRLRRASKDERRALYAVVYAERSARIPHHPLVRAAAERDVRAQAVLPQVRLIRHFARPTSTFLEIGAGDAAVALGVAPFVERATAVDVTGALVDSSRMPPNFEFREFDGFELPVPAAGIDLAYSNDVAEHLHPDDLDDHLRAVRKALRPGGRYICVTPNRLSGPHDVSRHFSATPQGFHLREYTAGELADAFAAAGFSRVETVASFRGRVLGPLPTLRWARRAERAIALLPPRARRRAATPLAAIKLIGRA